MLSFQWLKKLTGKDKVTAPSFIPYPPRLNIVAKQLDDLPTPLTAEVLIAGHEPTEKPHRDLCRALHSIIVCNSSPMALNRMAEKNDMLVFNKIWYRKPITFPEAWSVLQRPENEPFFRMIVKCGDDLEKWKDIANMFRTKTRDAQVEAHKVIAIASMLRDQVECLRRANSSEPNDRCVVSRIIERTEYETTKNKAEYMYTLLTDGIPEAGNFAESLQAPPKDETDDDYKKETKPPTDKRPTIPTLRNAVKAVRASKKQVKEVLSIYVNDAQWQFTRVSSYKYYNKFRRVHPASPKETFLDGLIGYATWLLPYVLTDYGIAFLIQDDEIAARNDEEFDWTDALDNDLPPAPTPKM